MKKRYRTESHLTKSIAITISMVLTLLVLLVAVPLKLTSADLIEALIIAYGVFELFSISLLAVFCVMPLKKEISDRLNKFGHTHRILLNQYFAFVSLVLAHCLMFAFFMVNVPVAQHILTCSTIVAFTFGVCMLIGTTYSTYLVAMENNNED